MKKLVLFALLGTGLVFGQSKKVEKANINWWGYKVAKTEASSHTGDIQLKTGELTLNRNRIIGGAFVLDMTTINTTDLTPETGKTKLEDHLKNNDFFEVEKYPSAEFKITSIKAKKAANANSVITGNLTVKGITKAISFPAKVWVKNGMAYLTTEKITINRQDFGVVYKSSMKDVFIKDDIELKVVLSAKI